MSEFIQPSQLKEQLGTENEPKIIDVRAPEEFQESHIPGALNIPIDELSERLAELPKDQLIVPYCNMHHPGNSRGEKAQKLLLEHGFQALAIDGGFVEWNRLGLTVDAAANTRYLNTYSEKWQTTKSGGEMLVLRAEPGAKRMLFRFPAGSQSPQHQHTFVEEVYVLEGVYVNMGKEYGPGSYLYFPSGHDHAPASTTGCTILVIQDHP